MLQETNPGYCHLVDKNGPCAWCGTYWDGQNQDAHPEILTHPYWHTLDHVICTECNGNIVMICPDWPKLNCDICKTSSGCGDHNEDMTWIQCENCYYEKNERGPKRKRTYKKTSMSTATTEDPEPTECVCSVCNNNRKWHLSYFYYTCEGDMYICGGCSRNNKEFCDNCHKSLCYDCRSQRDCGGCDPTKLLNNTMLIKSKRGEHIDISQTIRKLLLENEQLKKDVSQLRKDVDKLLFCSR